MATKTWNGSSADWNNSGDWSGGTPGATDTADISNGSVSVGPNDNINAGSLNLTGGSLTVQGDLNLTTANAGNGYVPVVKISGGSFTVDGGAVNFGSYLNAASGTIAVINSGNIQWNGTSPSLVDGMTGSTSGLNIDLKSGQFQIEKPFDGSITDFGGSDLLSFDGKITSTSYSSNILTVNTDAALTYSLHFNGTYQASNFAVSADSYFITYSASVANTTPMITSASSTPNNADLNTNKTVTFTLVLNEAVNATGSTLTLSNGATATLDANSNNTANLIYRYVVSSGDNNVNSLTADKLNGNIIDSNGGSLDDSKFSSINTNDTIDTQAPTISSITLDKTAYGLNDTVTATIHLAGSSDGNGAYTLGTGSKIDGATLTAGNYNASNNTLTASFIVGANSTEVIAGNVTTNVSVNDAATNASVADTTSIGSVTIDTHAPTAVSVAGFSNGSTDTGHAPVAAGSQIGALSTTDVSPNDSFSYALGGSDASRFAISNGTLDVGSTALTDGSTYNFTVIATDLGGNKHTQAVQVTGATTPTVTSIVPAGASPTNAPSDPFTVKFSQAVNGVQASNFTLSGTDSTGTVGTPTTQDGVTWTVPVTGVSGNGTLGLDLTSTASITSTSTGTSLAGPRTSDQTYTIDTTLTTPTIAFAPSNSAAAAADVNAAHAATAGYTVGNVDADATGAVTFTGTLKSTGATGTVAGMGTNGAHTVDLSGFQDGTVSAAISDRDTAGNTRIGTAVSTNLDTTPPAITSAAETGNGIGANGDGDVSAGTVVTTTVQTDGPVYVTPAADGSTPTLVFNNGGVATYAGQTGTAVNQLTFSYTVQKGQDTKSLELMDVTGADDITDQAGNVINLGSLATANLPTGTLVIDTTPPVVSSPTAVAAQNSGPTPIGIAAPSDNLTAASSLVILANSLPTDGTVTLADGTTRVVAGQSLTAAQLQGLEFTPTPGVSNQVSTFAYTVADGAGNTTQGTAALNVGSPGAPTITGTHVTGDQAETPVAPFTGVTVADPSSAAGAIETLAIGLMGQGGVLADGASYAGPRTLSGGGTAYQISGTAAQVTAELDALSFIPTAGAPGTTTSTNFVLTNRSSAGTSVADSGTTVADTATAQPAPTPVTPDAVSLSPKVSYDQGVFTLTGTASSPAGVRSVEISAVVDGVRQDLGAATVNPDGTFAFQDAAGDQQGFFIATLTDGAGGTATSPDPSFSLTGGLGPNGSQGQQTRYSADGSIETAVTRFLADGSQRASVTTGGRTFTSNFFDKFNNKGAPETTFVFNPGHGLDIVNGFRVNGTDHDFLSFTGSDFGNSVAQVLQNTYQTDKNGNVIGHAGDPIAQALSGISKGAGVIVYDPVSMDTVKVNGITKGQLAANQGDFTFHA